MGTEGKQLEIEITHLHDLDLDGLRRRWRTEFGRKALRHVPAHLMRRILAHRCQARVLGDLSRSTVQFLERLARSEPTDAKAAAIAVSVPSRNRLKPGTVLVREHEGTHHHVMVTDSGFVWNGTTYPSLTKIAFAITKTRWNGPRFFGLREDGAGTSP
jgi:hypothetical protein